MKHFVTKQGSIIQTDTNRKTITTINCNSKNLFLSIQHEDDLLLFEQKFEEMGLVVSDPQLVHDLTNAITTFLKGNCGFDVFQDKINSFHIEDNIFNQ
jgi:hypothetical protein